MDLQGINIGQKIRKIRELRNLTQQHMAQELGVTQSAYSKLEMGESDITYKKLEQISSILGISVEEIAAFNEQMVFNVMHNQTGNGLVVNKGISDQERVLYEDQIQFLKEQNEYLKRMLEKVLEK
jgi:transcriptional regulator with XRE-family HTH domain